MKKVLFLLLIFLSFGKAQDLENEVAIELSRLLSKDLFELNGIDIMQPSVEVLNATSNSRFYYTANVPIDNKWHFRFGIHMMTGFVPDRLRTFNPALPSEEFNLAELLNYGTIDIETSNINIQDTVGISYYILKTLINDGIYQGTIEVPESGATLLGKDSSALVVPQGELSRLALARFDSISTDLGGNISLPEEVQDQIIGILNQIPSDFTLPAGGDIRTILAGIPQFDIGYNGWELNLRYIPKLNYGDEFGDFGFFGLGLKNMISQYFTEIDDPNSIKVALQMAVQVTGLENKVGVTQATLKSDATIFNINLHSSKLIEDWFEIFAGISYEYISTTTSYKYTLPVEIQYQLGLLEKELE
ncbi:hypothetical protein OAQ99_07500, partial [Candidatus Kapabacteria bacterium]|nr:hypothetical protein [Candidatus Kapabacteria bacterium]